MLRDYAGGEQERVPFAEASYSAGFTGNPEFAPDSYRLAYSSMVTPATVYDYHPAEKRLETRKVQEIPSGYDACQYVTERLTIAARDGAKVPVSVLRRKDFAKDGSGKLFVYGYGAYGFAIPPSFSTSRLSLVDRGFAFAIAHIRGGDDLGYQWFLDGKLDKRTNTFNDFVDVTRGLIAEGYAKAGPGRSAGRLGRRRADGRGGQPGRRAVWRGGRRRAVRRCAQHDARRYAAADPRRMDRMGQPDHRQGGVRPDPQLQPYDNVAAKPYPPMLITGGLTDPRVTYWEPAKWAARLRATKTDDNLLLLKTNMGAGHGGKSGRWNALHELAEAYAFVVTQLGD